MATFTVPTTGSYVDSVNGGRYKYTAGVLVDLDWAVRLQMPGASLPADAAPFTDSQVAWLQDGFEPEGDFATTAELTAATTPETQSVTATVTGATTGTISDPTSGSVFVTVTSDDANKIVKLPTPTPGTVVAGYVGATGFESRSSAPASVGINGGTGANAESAIPASTFFLFVCTTATNWLLSLTAADGVVSNGEAAA